MACLDCIVSGPHQVVCIELHFAVMLPIEAGGRYNDYLTFDTTSAKVILLREFCMRLLFMSPYRKTCF